MSQPEYAIVGRVRKAQGIRGEVLVEPLTDTPDAVFASGSRVFTGDVNGNLAPGTLTIENARPHKGGLIIKFEEIADRGSAELWRGRFLLAPFAELPAPSDSELYLHELSGMKVLGTTGRELGSVTAFYELPQGVILDVKTDSGSVLIPYRPEIVREMDRTARTLVVDEEFGLLD